MVGPTGERARESGGTGTTQTIAQVVVTDGVAANASGVVMLEATPDSERRRSKSLGTNSVRSSVRSKTFDSELAVVALMNGGALDRSHQLSQAASVYEFKRLVGFSEAIRCGENTSLLKDGESNWQSALSGIRNMKFMTLRWLITA